MNQSTLEKIHALKATRIQAETEATPLLTSGFSIDLAPYWEQLDQLTKTSVDIWNKKPGGQRQVTNQYNTNFTGHAAELTAFAYYQQHYTNVEAPDLTAYLNNTEETSDFDILADDLKIQVKGISLLLSGKYQVTPYNVHEYINNSTDEIMFCYVDKINQKGYVYGRTTPQAMLQDNNRADNDQGKSCFSGERVLLN
ncbi:hypothetical protein [Psychromonas aquimarina]|uniref:hypothetical protein n=1 Tax=Psychromonas aquimarina TaxID=444919 RepID=UPI00041465BA|nr:hypothetical protein [Psychromonas aquimarina]